MRWQMSLIIFILKWEMDENYIALMHMSLKGILSQTTLHVAIADRVIHKPISTSSKN